MKREFSELRRERDKLKVDYDAVVQEKMNAILDAEQAKRDMERWKAAVCRALYALLRHELNIYTRVRRQNGRYASPNRTGADSC